MTLETIKEKLGELSKDAKLNMSSVLKESGAPGLNQNQIHGLALACAYALKDPDLVEAIKETGVLGSNEVQAAKTAAILMAMNNVYYRFIHLSEDSEIGQLPAKLRMTAMANPGVDKSDFEIYSLGISAISGCGMCINAHMDVLKKSGFSKEAIQSVVRIAAVISSAAKTLAIGRMG